MKKIIVAGPVIIEDKRVLLVKAGSDNYWKYPGGKMERFETQPQEAARREPLEELGLEIEIINPIPYILEKEKAILYHYLSRRLGEIRGGTAREWKWIPITELDELDKEGELAPNIIPTLKHFQII